MYVRSLALLLVICYCTSVTVAQTPFTCDGSAYLVLSPNNLSRVFRVNADLSSGAVTYDLISQTTGLEINAIGYRKTDNLIYGINRDANGLYRIDANGTFEFLAFPDLPSDDFYAAADVSPDGRFLVLLSYEDESPLLRYVDLEDGAFTVTQVMLSPLREEGFFCTDIAFDPLSGLLYGFDLVSSRLIVIDPENGIADNASFPTLEVVDNLPSLFFDSFGNLFGLSSRTGAGASLYKLDIETGIAEVFAPASSFVGNSDGCSCPYSIALNQTFAPTQTFPCTPNLLTIRIANLTNRPLLNASLAEELPAAWVVQEVVSNPFSGTIGNTIGSNQIELNEMIIPTGLDSIVCLIDVGETPPGIYRSQAELTIIDLAPGLDTTVVSDNPDTPVPLDSSVLEIVPLFVDLDNNQTQLCVGDELVLRSSIGLGLSYEWNDGSTTPQLLVNTPGLYSVTVSTGCETAFDTITIAQASLEVELGEDISIELGDEVTLNPAILAAGAIEEYLWFRGVNPPEPIDCPDCSTYTEVPLFSTPYTIVVRDEFGCEAEDQQNVEVLKNYNLFAPNAFSPNQDGRNDSFFLQTKQPLVVEDLRVFDRWGGLLFEVEGGTTNSPADGWNGTSGGELAPNGLYIWTANVRWIDGSLQPYTGDILLLR